MGGPQCCCTRSGIGLYIHRLGDLLNEGITMIELFSESEVDTHALKNGRRSTSAYETSMAALIFTPEVSPRALAVHSATPVCVPESVDKCGRPVSYAHGLRYLL